MKVFYSEIYNGINLFFYNKIYSIFYEKFWSQKTLLPNIFY